jgi:DNA-binding IclR family transcriptional regulator
MVFCVVILLDNGLQYLIEINRKTMLPAFLGIRSGLKAVIIDKVDTAFDLKISSEVGMRLPLFAGGRRQGVDAHASG